MVSSAVTIRWISGQWHLVVIANGSQTSHPAATKLEAEIMAVRERRRLLALGAGAD